MLQVWIFFPKNPSKDGQEKGREDGGRNQGPDTLVVFVRNSQGCKDTHEPVRGGCQYRFSIDPIENLYGHEDLAQTYEQWLKTENERLDSEEIVRKTVRKMTVQKVQDPATDQVRKKDKFTKKTKGTDNTV